MQQQAQAQQRQAQQQQAQQQAQQRVEDAHEVGALFELMGRAEGARDGEALQQVQAEYEAQQAAQKRKVAFKALLEQQERPEEGAVFESFGGFGGADLEKGGAGGAGGAIVARPWTWLVVLDYALLALSLALMVWLVSLAFSNQMTIFVLSMSLSSALIAYAASFLVFFLRRRRAQAAARSDIGSAGVASRGPLSPRV
jgi:hypothetical protein